MEKINPRLKQPAEHAFLFKHDRDVHGGGQGKKRKKTHGSRAYEFSERPLIDCDLLLF